VTLTLAVAGFGEAPCEVVGISCHSSGRSRHLCPVASPQGPRWSLGGSTQYLHSESWSSVSGKEDEGLGDLIIESAGHDLTGPQCEGALTL
jgi:hypothetical protein